MTRTAHRWRVKPGSFDALHATQLYPASNAYGIPDLLHPSVMESVTGSREAKQPAGSPPGWLAPYRTRIRAEMPPEDRAVHFFLDDCRFETVWNRPVKALVALAPLYHPAYTGFFLLPGLAARDADVERLSQSLVWPFLAGAGLSRHPRREHRSQLAFSFLAIPRRGLVAVPAVGVRLEEPLAYQLFLDGFREMVARLEPTIVLSYGPLPQACHELVEVRTYPTRWQGIRAARANNAMRSKGMAARNPREERNLQCHR